jgi:hypothetical protein
MPLAKVIIRDDTIIFFQNLQAEDFLIWYARYLLSKIK